MAVTKELILLYAPSGDGAEVKRIAVPMGVRIKNITKEQLGLSVGELAGRADCPAPEGASCPAPVQDVLVLCGFTEQRLDQLLGKLRRAGAARTALKAVLTPNNAGWSFAQLCAELAEEHRQMTAGET